jgi:lipoprotein-releasing system permease protein
MAWAYEIQLARRNLASHPWHTAAMVAGLALAVVVMIYIPSTMGSFYEDIIDRSVEQTSAHVTVWPRERNKQQLVQTLRQSHPEINPQAIEDHTFPRKRDLTGYSALAERVSRAAEVLAVAPFVKADATISRGKVSMGIVVEGIIPQQHARVVNIAKHYEGNRVPQLKPDDIAIGYRLAEKLGVQEGGRVHVATPTTAQKLRVRAIYRSGYYQNDLAKAYVTLKTAQVLFGMGNDVSGLAVRCSDLNRADVVTAQLRQTIPFKIRNWMDDNASLLQEIATMKRVTVFISALVALVASVGMANVFSMFVLNRQKELAILRAMGAARLSLRTILLMEAAFIWLIGTIVGLIAVLGVMAYEQANPYEVSAETYGIGAYATRPDLHAMIVGVAMAAGTMLLSAWWSGRRVAKLNPATVIFGK